MSVSSEIERIQGAKADIKAAIEAKGVTVGAGLIDTYTDKVAQISGGGGNYNSYTASNTDDYGVLDFGEDPNKWMVWNDSAGLYDPLFIPFLRSIDQTVEWNEIIVEEAEPVS